MSSAHKPCRFSLHPRRHAEWVHLKSVVSTLADRGIQKTLSTIIRNFSHCHQKWALPRGCLAQHLSPSCCSALYNFHFANQPDCALWIWAHNLPTPFSVTSHHTSLLSLYQQPQSGHYVLFCIAAGNQNKTHSKGHKNKLNESTSLNNCI